MKRLKLIFILLVMASCQKEDTLSLSTSSVDITADTYISQLTITSNTAWSISGGDGWVSCSPSSGTGTATVTLTVEKNTASTSRSTSLKVSAGSLNQTIAVSQKQKDALILTKSLEAFPYAGGSATVELKSNITYDVTIPASATWLTLTQTKAMSTYQYSLQVSQNSSLSSRSAEIIFKDKVSRLSDTLEVFQDGPDQISLTTKNYYIARAGATISVDLTYNIEYEIVSGSGVDWVTTASTKATSTKNYSFVVAPNTSTSDRFANIIFRQKSVAQGKTPLADTVIIKQSSFDGTYIYLNGTNTLASQIPSGTAGSIVNLKIEGKIKSSDFNTIRSNIIYLKNIDLGSVRFDGDSLPSEAFLMTTPASALETVVLPETLEKIGKNAFNSCIYLKSITLPAAVKSIGTMAFFGCTSLATITSKISTPFEVTKVFTGISSMATLIVPVGSLNSYQTTNGWGYTVFKYICEVGTNPSEYLRIEKYIQNSVGLGGTYPISVSSSGSWSVEKKPAWITLNTTGTLGVSTMQVTFAPYTGSTMREDSVILRLGNSTVKAILKVRESGLQYDEQDYITLQKATVGTGVDIVLMGDGYTFDEIVSGKYETKIREAFGHFFNIEPYKTYQQYFNVYMVYAFSPESGISDIETTVNSTFGTKFTKAQPSTSMTTTSATAFTYAACAPITNIAKTLVIMVANSTRYGGTCIMYSDGKAIAMCPTSTSSYPYDFRGLVQHEAGGHGFGKLADEYTNYSETIPSEEVSSLQSWQSNYGFYKNVDVTNNLTSILWKHFIGVTKYTGVGAYEGGYYYTKGVWRPENTSVMINNIKYYNGPSREMIVRRIMTLAGMTYTFENFMINDVVDTSPATKAANIPIDPKMFLAPPILIP